MSSKLVLFLIIELLLSISNTDSNVVMKCVEPNQCGAIENSQSVYNSPLLSLDTIDQQSHFSLQIVEYSDFILFRLIDDDTFNEYTNLSFPTHSLYQLHTAKEIIQFIESSVNQSISQITPSLIKQSDESLLLTVYIRYEILNRDIILSFIKQKENEFKFMNKLIQKFNHYKENMDAKLDSIMHKIDALKEENQNLQYELKNNHNIPTGIIMMFHGGINNIPQGYILCDGNNGTPDLRDKFIVGSGNIYHVGQTGGDITHHHIGNTHSETLDIESTEVRIGCRGRHKHKHRHHHHHNDDRPNKKVINSIIEERHSHGIRMEEENHLPPFYSTIFIMKT